MFGEPGRVSARSRTQSLAACPLRALTRPGSPGADGLGSPRPCYACRRPRLWSASLMLAPFFALAARSPSRQRSFRNVVAAHLVLLGAAVLLLLRLGPGAGLVAFGHMVFIAGIVEGATLVGWRLTQLPRSQALEIVL